MISRNGNFDLSSRLCGFIILEFFPWSFSKNNVYVNSSTEKQYWSCYLREITAIIQNYDGKFQQKNVHKQFSRFKIKLSALSKKILSFFFYKYNLKHPLLEFRKYFLKYLCLVTRRKNSSYPRKIRISRTKISSIF